MGLDDMRFEEKLRANAHSEWLAHYVDYAGLKDMLHPPEAGMLLQNMVTQGTQSFSVTTNSFVEMQSMREEASPTPDESCDPALKAMIIGGTVANRFPKTDSSDSARSARFRVALVREVAKVN